MARIDCDSENWLPTMYPSCLTKIHVMVLNIWLAEIRLCSFVCIQNCYISLIYLIRLSGLSPFMGDNDAETLANVTTAEWDFDDPVFEDISQEAKEFIEDLLVKNQK